ncbi:MAG: DNA/RNA non-specific endonuclease [Bacteroidales bacterium]|jgi:endonuclease G|nr:DNA/RNA non-specific endonuclease [Bacteroidales bacterium]
MDRQKRNSIITLVVLALLGTVYHFVWGSSGSEEPTVVPDKDLMSRLEIPYRLEDNESTIIEHMGYALSYNSDYRVPNWVAYELLETELTTGFRSREDGFEPDPMIKGRQAYDRDYVGSGYDRGHMAPAADMRWSSQTMKESFYLSNVCPQDHNLNSGAWNDLEKQVRYEARFYKSVWVVCGPIFNYNNPRHIGQNHVMVPDAFFKALLARRKDGSYASIGFIFPNVPCTRNLTLYAMTVDELEAKLGMDLFYNLETKAQDRSEAVMDPYGDWRIRDEILRD